MFKSLGNPNRNILPSFSRRANKRKHNNQITRTRRLKIPFTPKGKSNNTNKNIKHNLRLLGQRQNNLL